MSGVHPIQLLDKPIAHPFLCAKCGSGSNREHYVDIGLDGEFESEQYGQPHFADGVIYLCNMCMTDLLSRYVFSLFDFINTQRSGVELEGLKKINELSTLHQEIDSLRAIIDNQSAQIRMLQGAELIDSVGESADQSAAELVGNLLGSDDNGTGIITPDNQDAAGSAANSDSDDSGVKSNDSILEIKLGAGVLGGTVSIPA